MHVHAADDRGEHWSERGRWTDSAELDASSRRPNGQRMHGSKEWVMAAAIRCEIQPLTRCLSMSSQNPRPSPLAMASNIKLAGIPSEADARAKGVKTGAYEFDPANARSERGKAHAAALRAQAFEPLIPVPLARRGYGSIVCGLIVVALFGIIVQLIHTTNMLVKLRPHHFEQCHVMTGPIGSEDVALDVHSVTFISSDDRVWLPTISRDGIRATRALLESNMANPDTVQGAIWSYDSRAPESSPTAGQLRKLVIEGAEQLRDFHPHGIHLPTPPKPSDPIFLYVLSHERDHDSVLVVEVVYTRDGSGAPVWPPRLVLQGWMVDPLLKGINDLTGFYPVFNTASASWTHTLLVSNFLGSTLGNVASMVFESAVQARWGSVVLCKATSTTLAAGSKPGLLATECTRAISDISGPNGLAITKDQRQLLVACTLTTELRVYDFPVAASGAPEAAPAASPWTYHSRPLLPLTLSHTLVTRTGLDNLSVDDLSGDVFIGSHPKPLEVAAHLEDYQHKTAPTQVLRLHKRTQQEIDAAARDPASASSSPLPAGSTPDPLWALTEEHLSLGEVFSGSSVGVWSRARGEIIIGGVAQDGIFVYPYAGREGEAATTDAKDKSAAAQPTKATAATPASTPSASKP